MKFARIIAFLLCLAMVSLVFVSCGETEVTTKAPTTDPAQTTDAWVPDGLPELNYEGEKVRILSRSDDWFYDELSLKPEESLNIIDESICKREAYVAERLGVELDVDKVVSRGQLTALTNSVRSYFESAVDVYDLVAGSCYHLMPLSTEGILYDWREIDNVDLDQPWYAQNFIELSTINDHNIFVTGDAALSLMRLSFVTFINLDLASTYGCADIYDVVTNHEWTIDYQMELVSNVYEDLSGDSTVDSEDLFGMTMSLGAGVDLYWSAFNMEILANDGEGQLFINIDNEKVSAALEKLCSFHHDNPGVYAQPGNGDLEYDTMKQYFASNQRLFMNNHLISVESEFLINMESPYGIVPAPMWDTDQDGYYTYVHDQYTVFGIMGTVPEDKLPIIGAFMEVTSNYSYNETRDVYFEIALKGRYARDEQSRVMLDTIVESIKIDAGWIYSGCLNDFANKFRNLVSAKDNRWASNYRALGKILESNLGKLNLNYGPVK